MKQLDFANTITKNYYNNEDSLNPEETVIDNS